MKWKPRTVDEIAEYICGNGEKSPFVYRSSWYLSRFFADAETEHQHDGSSRATWVSGVLTQLLAEPHADARIPPTSFLRVIQILMDKGDAKDGDPDRTEALQRLNRTLQREGYEAFYADDQKCYLRHTGTGSVAQLSMSPHRPFSQDELQRRERLLGYLQKISEDQLIEEILLPLFRQIGFHRITASGHKDKALEYGKDIWMRFVLPTQHVLYFGLQAKREKLDASGVSKGANSNIAEILNQVTMMLGHEIFDPETNKKVLVDHAFIVAGGEITKAARNWLGGRLDQSKRSQVMFIDRDDILNLYVVTGLPLPAGAVPAPPKFDDDIPF